MRKTSSAEPPPRVTFPQPFFRWRPHPWHGLDLGPKPPEVVHAYIELTPFDRVKYELDKKTGYLRVDRPNRTSAFSPTRNAHVGVVADRITSHCSKALSNCCRSAVRAAIAFL